MQRACPSDHQLSKLTGQDVGLMPPLLYCLGACLMLLLHGFVTKQACLVLWLSKPAFFSNHKLTGVSHIFFYLQSLSGINYLITHCVPLCYFYQIFCLFVCFVLCFCFLLSDLYKYFRKYFNISRVLSMCQTHHQQFHSREYTEACLLLKVWSIDQQHCHHQKLVEM